MAALDFQGQTVWVTGAGKGIGYATALAFVEAGAQVTVLTSRSRAKAIRSPPRRWTWPDAPQVAEVCQRLLGGIERLDVLVNAAGILRMGATDALSVEEWQQTLRR
ncbi:2,3-dihydro-2,3-dihydroxybenzoate dehydrogenase [Raoultella terrigena]|uniref:2,3-dihydro-2,3-dihydroxybenzoate dehydrogenase n=1 Tax=Raoultella terrigena TaxID=577 RepID=A0A4U9DB79_RAOTE|nr:2,3-dihydro-2,3-dihydroxybenzoate dehydrogenase [Raoultella terrigena]